MPIANHITAIRELVPLLVVQNMPSALAFYRQLGFNPTATWEPDDVLTWCRLERGAAALMLQQAVEEDGAAERRGRGVEFFFLCDDVDGLHAEFVGLGIEVKPPRVAFYGMKQIFLKDPDGYDLCFQSITHATSP